MEKMILMKNNGIRTVSLIPVMILFLLSAPYAFAGGTEVAPIVEEELVQSAEEISASEETTEDAEPVEEEAETEEEAVTDEETEAGEERTASTDETYETEESAEASDETQASDGTDSSDETEATESQEDEVPAPAPEENTAPEEAAAQVDEAPAPTQQAQDEEATTTATATTPTPTQQTQASEEAVDMEGVIPTTYMDLDIRNYGFSTGSSGSNMELFFLKFDGSGDFTLKLEPEVSYAYFSQNHQDTFDINTELASRITIETAESSPLTVEAPAFRFDGSWDHLYTDDFGDGVFSRIGSSIAASYTDADKLKVDEGKIEALAVYGRVLDRSLYLWAKTLSKRLDKELSPEELRKAEIVYTKQQELTYREREDGIISYYKQLSELYGVDPVEFMFVDNFYLPRTAQGLSVGLGPYANLTYEDASGFLGLDGGVKLFETRYAGSLYDDMMWYDLTASPKLQIFTADTTADQNDVELAIDLELDAKLNTLISRDFLLETLLTVNPKQPFNDPFSLDDFTMDWEFTNTLSYMLGYGVFADFSLILNGNQSDMLDELLVQCSFSVDVL